MFRKKVGLSIVVVIAALIGALLIPMTAYASNQGSDCIEIEKIFETASKDTLDGINVTLKWEAVNAPEDFDVGSHSGFNFFTDDPIYYSVGVGTDLLIRQEIIEQLDGTHFVFNGSFLRAYSIDPKYAEYDSFSWKLREVVAGEDADKWKNDQSEYLLTVNLNKGESEYGVFVRWGDISLVRVKNADGEEVNEVLEQDAESGAYKLSFLNVFESTVEEPEPESGDEPKPVIEPEPEEEPEPVIEPELKDEPVIKPATPTEEQPTLSGTGDAYPYIGILLLTAAGGAYACNRRKR